MFQEAYSAIEEHSVVDHWHFEVDMDVGKKSFATPYISSLGTCVTYDTIISKLIKCTNYLFKIYYKNFSPPLLLFLFICHFIYKYFTCHLI